MFDYSFGICIIQMLAAIMLFFIVNWIGKNSISAGYVQLSTSIAEDSYPAFNFLFKVIAPPVYLVLYATICQSVNLECLNNHCYLLVVYYWLFRALFVLATGKGRLTNWMTYIIYTICSIGISYWIYTIINNVDEILPDPKDLLNQLWLLIIIFLYEIFNKLEFGRKKTIRRKEAYIAKQYSTLHSKFGTIVRKCCIGNEFFEAVTFAIMIYENFNRPKVVRWIEKVHFEITKREHTLGVMQVKTTKAITDEESIVIAIDYIKDSFSKMRQEAIIGSDALSGTVVFIAEKYNGGSPGYIDEVYEVFKYLNDNFYKNVTEESLKKMQND